MSKSFLISTSPNGAVNYADYYRYYLSNLSEHCEGKIKEHSRDRQVLWRRFIGQWLKYSGSFPGRHLMLQPRLGFCSFATILPSSKESSAARRS